MRVVANKNSSGFSLLEAIVMMAVLSGLIGGVFMLFTYSVQGFNQALSRQGLSGENEAIRQKLTADFRPTHFATVGVVPRTTSLDDGTDVSRDAFSFATLSNWRDSGNFYSTGIPRWNRQVVYYPTREESGRLIRQVINTGPITPPRPYSDLSANLSDLPESNADLEQSNVLSRNVLSLTVSRNDARQLLDITLKLRVKGARAMGANARVMESQEAVFSLEAFNTFPRL